MRTTHHGGRLDTRRRAAVEGRPGRAPPRSRAAGIRRCGYRRQRRRRDPESC